MDLKKKDTESPFEKTVDEDEETEDWKEQGFREQRNYDTYYAEDKIGGFASGLMKIFFCILMIPFVGIIVALSCALGAMVVLSIQGFTLFGAYFILIGAIMVTSAFLNAFYRLLWKRGHRS